MRLIDKLKSKPWHVAGLLLFFISHGYSEYTWLIPFKGLLLLLSGLLAASFLVFLLFRKLLSSPLKAGLITTWIFTFLLFYGAFQDLFKQVSFLTWLSRYRSLLTAFLLVTIALFIYLKRKKSDFPRATLYLNTLLMVLIAVDGVTIVRNIIRGENQPTGVAGGTLDAVTPDAGMKKPDIYFIILDEYSGSKALKTFFNYDNSRFETELRAMGFHVAAAPHSNYPATLLSMASIFTMDTVKWMKGRMSVEAGDYSIAQKVIANSDVPRFLNRIGYNFYNYSIFDIGHTQGFVNMGFIPVDIRLLTAKTLVGRMEKDLAWNLVVSGANGTNALADEYRDGFRDGINKMLSATRKAAGDTIVHPKFVYTHFMMPHPPFIYDSTGVEMTKNYIGTGTNVTAESRAGAYLQYLIYTNTFILKLVREIKDKTREKAVIMVMSDHGYRDLPRKPDPFPWSNNLNAVFIPGKDYRLFSDTISNVNQFRVLFNSLFNTQVPVLPDNYFFGLQTNKANL